MANLANRLNNADTTFETVEVLKDIEATARDFPDRSLPFSKYLVPLFGSPSASIRKSAFNSAISIVTSQPAAGEQLLNAYGYALLSTDREVARHALTYLPQFVAASTDRAESLIQCALEASQRQPGPHDAHLYIAQAMDVVKKIGLPK